MTRTFRPISADNLADVLADMLVRAAADRAHALRAAVDGPAAGAPLALAGSLVEPLRLRGHDTVVIDARTFWRDASLRLEYGREDPDSYPTWLDVGALRREVLDAAAPAPGSGRDAAPASVLPALRDPDTNRSVRAARRAVSAGTVVLVAGELMLGRDLPYDVTIHLAMTPGARRRRTEPARQWTLPAFDHYDAHARPADVADVVIRVDDPRHPALG